MATGDRSFPFDNGSANEPEWRELFGATGDGIVDDSTGGAFNATVNTGTQEVSVAAGRFRNAGAMLTAINPEVLALSTGSQPANGQTRVDYVVVRTDYTANTVVRALVAGTPAASASAQPPTLTRSLTGVWETPIWRVNRSVTGGTTSIQLTDLRRWAGPTTTALGDFLPDSPVAIGHTAVQGTFVYRRVLPTAGGAPYWATSGYRTGSLGYLTGYTQMPAPYTTDTPRYVQDPLGVRVAGMVYRSGTTFTRSNGTTPPQRGVPFDVTPPLPAGIRPDADRHIGLVDTQLGPARMNYRASTGRLEISYPTTDVTITTQIWWVNLNSGWIKE